MAVSIPDVAQHAGAIALLVLAAGALAGYAVVEIAVALLRRFTTGKHEMALLVIKRAHGPMSFVVPFIVVEMLLGVVDVPEHARGIAEHGLGIAIIVAIAWVAIAIVQLFSDLAERSFEIDAHDDLHLRQVRTRFEILERAVISIVVFVAGAAVLMTFPPIRALGATLLASAGLIGLAAGVAARPVFENLVAGIQIALTQPIRIGDGIVIDKDYGKVEKIGPTFIVIKLWDLRRMVVPLSYFIDKPFQNWTYESTELVGSVMLYLGHSVPLDRLRDELSAVLAQTPLWDGKTEKLAMTEAREGSIEIRILVSARDATELFDLRCFVRERMVAFVQDAFPAGLPSTRVVLDRGDWPQGPPTSPPSLPPGAPSSSDP